MPHLVPTKLCSAFWQINVISSSLIFKLKSSFNPLAKPHSSAADELTPDPIGISLTKMQSNPERFSGHISLK